MRAAARSAPAASNRSLTPARTHAIERRAGWTFADTRRIIPGRSFQSEVSVPFFHSAGLRLFYDEVGEGPPLILLHGFGQHGGCWADVLPTYARFFRVLVPDMRGCGRSEAGEPGFTTGDLALDVLALMDAAGAPEVHFSGWSLGGAVGVQLGIAHSDRLSSLTLNSSFAGGRTRYQRNWIEMRKRIILSGDRDLDIATRIIGFFSPDFVNEQPERIEEFRRRELANPYPGTEKGLAGQNQAAQQHEARDRLHLITAPTLITVGSADRTTLPAQSRLMHERITGSELVIFDGVGHFPQFQVSAEFCSVTLGFMMKHG
jgi:pimeloyl-ACP methyl ester carboxylesterase